MSRSGYSDDHDNWSFIRWRGAVNSAIKGKRGQAFLRELAAALRAFPQQKLIKNEMEHPLGGEFCTLGVLGQKLGLDMLSEDGLDVEDTTTLAKTFDVAEALIKEIVHENDDFSAYPRDKGEEEHRRWCYMLRWVEQRLIKPETPWLPPEELDDIFADTICGVASESYWPDEEDYFWATSWEDVVWYSIVEP